MGKYWSHSPEARERIRKAKLGEKNPMWGGDNIQLRSLHKWGERHIKKPKFCICCKIVPPRDLANISQEYKRDITDWEWLCRKCHMTKDGRIKKMAEIGEKGRISQLVKYELEKGGG